MTEFDQGGLTAREEWQEIVDREDAHDRLYGRGPFRPVEDYAEPRYARPRGPYRADESRDEDLAA